MAMPEPDDVVTQYLHIEFRGHSDSGKTRIWVVRAKEGGGRLGTIAWYSPWRGYVFEPGHGQLVFEQRCLRDLADFLETATRAQRQQAAARRSQA